MRLLSAINRLSWSYNSSDLPLCIHMASSGSYIFYMHRLYVIRDVPPMLEQCWTIYYDAGPSLHQHWLNVSCLRPHVARQDCVIGPVFSYKLWYIVEFWLVEMVISTNQKPTIYRNLYENTGPGLSLHSCIVGLNVMRCEPMYTDCVCTAIARHIEKQMSPGWVREKHFEENYNLS